MTVDYKIKSKQHYNTIGVVGVCLVLGSPVMAAVSLIWAASLSSTGGLAMLAPAILLAASGFLFTAGFCMMLVGRTTIHEVSADLPSAEDPN